MGIRMWKRFAPIAVLSTLLFSSAASAAFMGEDMIVLWDGSGSVLNSGFAGEKNFLVRLDDAMPGRDATRLGIILFSTTNVTKYSIASPQTPSLIDSAINTSSYPDQSTFLKDAVQTAINQFDLSSDPLDPRVLLLISDGGSPNPPTAQDPTPLLAALKSRGIQFVTATTGTPWVGFAAITAATGGASYVYSPAPFTAAKADQFFIDGAQYFNQGPVPEPATLCVVLTALTLLTVRTRATARRLSVNSGQQDYPRTLQHFQ